MTPFLRFPSFRTWGALLLCGALPLSGCASNRPAYRSPSSPEPAMDIDGDRIPTAKTLATMAHILAKRGDDAQCEVVLLKLIESHPDYGPAYCELAELYMRNGQRESALATLRMGHEVLPKDAVLQNNLGMLLLLSEDWRDAAEVFHRACQNAPNDARARANLGTCLALLGHLDLAEDLLLQAMSREEAWRNLSRLCYVRGDVRNAKLYRELAAGRGHLEHRKAREARAEGAS